MTRVGARALGLALAGCSARGGTPAHPSGTPPVPGQWVAVLVPKDIPPDTYPPIEKTTRVKTFATRNGCENYRQLALQDGAMLGSEAMLEEASSLRCIPDHVGSPTTPTK